MVDWVVEPPATGDFERWRDLYRDYAAFYDFPQTDSQTATVWAWIQDPMHEVRCLVVRGAHGVHVGLAHFRPFARPLRASTGCFLDDLFVDPPIEDRVLSMRCWTRCVASPCPRDGTRSGGSPLTTTTEQEASTTKSRREQRGSRTTCRPNASKSGANCERPEALGRPRNDGPPRPLLDAAN
jgi:hypothetical protein